MQGRKKTRAEIKRDLFPDIIAAAKKQDLDALKQLFATVGYPDISSMNDYNGDFICDCLIQPVIKFAQKCNTNAVNFLLRIRSNLIHDALEGYARGNHIEFVNLCISKGAHLNRAVFGAACAGHQPLVDNLLARGGAVKSAIVGYARGGFEAPVNDLLATNPQFTSLAVYGYAHGLHFKLLETLLAKKFNVFDAIRGFRESGYMQNKNNFLYLLTMVENQKLRMELMRVATQYPRHFDTKGMLQESDKLKLIMKRHELNYFQALAWSTLQFRIWMLYSPIFMKDRGLPLDMILYIAARIPACKPLPTKDLLDLRAKLDIHLYKSFVITSLNKCTVEEKRAKSLADACERVKTKHDLHTLIKYQKELFEKTRYVMPNKYRPAHERPFEDNTANAFTEIVDRYALKLK